MSQKTYTQIHIHVVFAVQNRERVLDEKWRDRLYKYIIAIMQKHGHKVLAIGGVDDHVHILFGHRSDHALPSLMAEIKRDSSKWINQNNLVIGKFIWQEGYAAFSYSKSDIGKVVKYIANQEKHHAGESSFEEYKNILKRSGMEFDERYLA